MARIKTILNERRLAYEQAYAIEHERYKVSEARAAAKVSGTETADGATSLGAPKSVEPTRGRRLRGSRRSAGTVDATPESSVETTPAPTPTPAAATA